MSLRSRKDFEESVVPLLRDDLEPRQELYEELCQLGQEACSDYLKERAALEGPVPSKETILGAHEKIFAAVYESAGAFRDHEVGVLDVATDKVWEAALADNIEVSLAELGQEVSELLAVATNDKEKAQAITYYHAKLGAVHPFADGNGRVAQAIMECQAKELLGHGLERITPESYGLGFADARSKDNLALLAAHTLGVELNEEQRQSPHTVEVWPQWVGRELPCGRPVELESFCVEDAGKVQRSVLDARISEYIKQLGIDNLSLNEPKDDRITLTERCERELRDREREHEWSRGR